MQSDIDYRLPEHRFEGFDKFYKFMLDTKDWSPDINVDAWVAGQLDYDFEQRCVLAFFYGATYSGPCDSIFAHLFPVLTAEVVPKIVEFFQANKQRLLFAPDCKYRKIFFERFLESVAESLREYGTLGAYIRQSFSVGSAEENYLDLKRRCTRDWFHWARMGHWCFTEALVHMANAPINPPTMEFSEGRSHTDGWAFTVSRDELVGKKKLRAEEYIDLERSAAQYLKSLGRPEADFLNLETACCNYKRQHKGTRYGGCYIDEQAEEIHHMRTHWPEYNWLWDKYFEGRRAVLPHAMLAELHPEAQSAPSAYVKSWNKALLDYGRIPRAEAWHNHEQQQWHDLQFMLPQWHTFANTKQESKRQKVMSPNPSSSIQQESKRQKLSSQNISFLYIVGAPGSGKSTLATAFLEQFELLERLQTPVKYERYRMHNGGILLSLGWQSGVFSGTDTLAFTAIKKLSDFLPVMATQDVALVFAEGDRLACRRFFELCQTHGNLQLVHLCTPESVTKERRLQRAQALPDGKIQRESWVAGRITKVNNLLAAFEHVVIDGQLPLQEQVQTLTEAMPCKS